MCVPDCRLNGNACPFAGLACETTSGLCTPDESGGGSVTDAGSDAGQPPDGGGPPPPDGGGPPPPDGGGPPPPDGGGLPPPDGGGGGGPDGGGGGTDAGGGGTDAGGTGSTPPTGSGQAEAKLTGGSTTPYGFGPGNNVSIMNDTIAIGSPGVSSRAGAVEMYRWSSASASWSLEQTLTASDADTFANFGTSVELDRSNADHLIVGDIWGQTSTMGPTVTTGPGEAFIFKRSGTTWTQAARIYCPDTTSVSQFGYAVSLYGKTAAIGWPRIYPAPGFSTTGMVVIYTENNAGQWSKAVNVTLTNYASYEFAGTSVSLLGTTLVVGAPGDWYRTSGTSAGRVEVFTGSSSTWTSQGSLTASDGVKWDQFGWSVAQSANTIVVGAPAHADSDGMGGTVSQAGAAYVFVKNGATWSQEAELVPPTPTVNGKFGYSVAAAADDKVVIGASGTKQLFMYTRSGATWTLAATYTACNSGSIGASLSASGNLAVSASTSAWVFDLADPDTSCVAP